ncbi:divalent-cation tolerance protein CutA [Myceligenerans indicum]|uniref:Divalent-cation tolerance protein CutA n=1 Tax=Myceligenerans indicum TaxID=2593663 RepID=A0ABS1LMU0_9MICO|nr:divalent-cation tolerance protein CutA [Myceligenerans indicum]MBL0886877.1 divalent-cation tolerance protein CutA [Myceligenerans indicum]
MSNIPGDATFVQVATTFDAEKDAEDLAGSVVEARLAACAQIDGPILSMFRWEGAMQKEREWRVTFKTTAALAEPLTERIVSEHPYDVPEVVVTALIGGHRDYLDWMEDETRRG